MACVSRTAAFSSTSSAEEQSKVGNPAGWAEAWVAADIQRRLSVGQPVLVDQADSRIEEVGLVVEVGSAAASEVGSAVDSVAVSKVEVGAEEGLMAHVDHREVESAMEVTGAVGLEVVTGAVGLGAIEAEVGLEAEATEMVASAAERMVSLMMHRRMRQPDPEEIGSAIATADSEVVVPVMTEAALEDAKTAAIAEEMVGMAVHTIVTATGTETAAADTIGIAVTTGADAATTGTNLGSGPTKAVQAMNGTRDAPDIRARTGSTPKTRFTKFYNLCAAALSALITTVANSSPDPYCSIPTITINSIPGMLRLYQGDG